MKYSLEEIELTLKLYPIAKIHVKELDNVRLLSSNEYCSEYNYYSHIIEIVDLWLERLYPDEIELLMLRICLKKTFDNIAVQLGYANHSSVVRKYKQIIFKIMGGK